MSSGSQTPKEKPAGIISDRVKKLSPSGIRKFFDLLASMDDVISLGVGEPDFATPWHISEAAIYSLGRGYTMYTSNSGMPELRRELSAYIEAHYELEYSPDTELLITVGVSEGLDLAMRALLNPGDEVIMTDPCYVAYEAAVVLSGGKAVRVATRQENDFEVEAADIEALVTEKTRAILLGYPANPTGAVMGREKLARIAEVARRRGLLVISDEIYARLVYGVPHTCFAGLPGMKDNTVLLGGFSKAYAMTGWRVGYAASSPEIIAAMTRVHQYTMMSEALRSGEDSASGMVAEYDKRRRVIVKGLNEIGLSCFEPKGAFYAFPSIVSTGLTSEDFAEKLLREEKVAVVPGSAFGPGGEGYVRCCYATALPDLEEALIRMGKFVSRHRPA